MFEDLFLLKGLTEDEKQKIISLFETPQKYKNGDIIYSADGFVTALGILLKGSAVAFTNNTGGVLMRKFKTGDVFGAAAIFGNNGKFVSTIIATADTEVLFIDESVLEEIFMLIPKASINYITFLSERIRFLNNKLSLISCSSAEDTVFSYLSSVKDSENNAVIPVSMSALAKMLGIGRASLYRSLEALENSGKINRNKKIVSLLLVLSVIFCFTSCGSNDTASEKPESKIEKLDVSCNVYALSGPTGIGMVSLMEKAEKGEGNLNYNINLAADNTEIIAKITNKEADIAAVATNVASTLYSKTNGGITVLAVNTEGVLTVVTKGEDIHELKDLKGKTVYATGQGANPEYIINYCLKENGLTIGTDVDLQFVAQPQELVSKAASSDKFVMIAPQPVATAITVKNADAKIVIDMNDEWEKVSDTDLVMGCIVARNDFIKENPEAIEIFLNEYKESIKTVSADVEKTAELCEKFGIVSPAAIAKKAIPYCHITFQTGKKMKKNLSAYLQFLYDSNPKSIGGSMPGDGFYY